jgi:hypothetical protein
LRTVKSTLATRQKENKFVNHFFLRTNTHTRAISQVQVSIGKNLLYNKE